MTNYTRALSLAPLLILPLVACGGRTDLFEGGLRTTPPGDASVDSSISSDAGYDSGHDSGYDGGYDAGHDAGHDAGFDAPLPSNLCTDASAPLIYVVTSANSLLRFDPTTSAFSVIATPNCGPAYYSPFSMAVDHTGTAFIEYQADGSNGSNLLARVSLASGNCTPVQLQGDLTDFHNYGMGFSVDDGGATETMYLAGAPNGRLGAVDEATLGVAPVGGILPELAAAELSGTKDGRLFAFTAQGARSGATYIDQLDKQSGSVIGSYALPAGVSLSGGFAFSFWGGDFYLFTAPTGTSIVTRYRPSDGTAVQVASYSATIVGAGASTCAPQ